MQILKEDVRNSILKAALAEFKAYDYSDASMRRISAAAGVTTGNIYRYFSNKEGLFEALVDPVYEKLMAYIMDIKQEIELGYPQEADSPKYMLMVENTIVILFEESSAELTILLNRSAGSKYSHVKSRIVTLVVSILERVFISMKKEESAELTVQERNTIDMLSGTIVEGVCLILREQEDGETVKTLVNQFLYLYQLDMEQRRLR
ncbi:TetR/AcrR family transcriptional regulator [Paenibacillus pini]|uniref:Transcriptional regulator n=1 Tax=Paenibacillus pini JCM 16418 TaxID=1236976 RepID=W7YV31_9BACL|nr:TetR/AcrR family transcriptional regulator [Paenibacillus pini]GAF08461.1 transcriptional regulator [Paenibacillus pini JCM 16418]